MALDLDPELRRQLIAEAETESITVTDFVSRLLHDHVARKNQQPDYDAWFDAEIEQALAEADDPLVERISDDVVRADLTRRMASLRSRM